MSTVYTVDGLGNQTSMVSPDTGTTTSTFDLAGNLATSTDARGIVTTFSYDALNRVTKIAFPTDTAILFEYDGGASGTANGVGHLTKMTDSSGHTVYTYGPFGRLLTKTRTVVSGANTVNLVNECGYGTSGNTTGKLVNMTYPSGNRIDYAYDESGRVSGLTLTAASGAPVTLMSVSADFAAHSASALRSAT